MHRKRAKLILNDLCLRNGGIVELPSLVEQTNSNDLILCLLLTVFFAVAMIQKVCSRCLKDAAAAAAMACVLAASRANW